MTVEEAIKTALAFETNVEDLYRKAMKAATDPIGKRVFGVLADEEKGHVGYLNNRLDEFKQSGTVTVEKLETIIPREEIIREKTGTLQSSMDREDRGSELQMLYKALDVEEKTSSFYRNVVTELSPDDRRLFTRFVEIEEGHVAIVRAEIDYLSGTGHWFDFREFDIEGGV